MNKFYVTEDMAEKLRAKGYYREYDVTCDWVEGIFYQVEDGTFHLPRIDEVLAWLRVDKIISVEPYASASGWRVTICRAYHQDRNDAGGGTCLKSEVEGYNDGGAFEKYVEASIAGIEYVIDNLI